MAQNEKHFKVIEYIDLPIRYIVIDVIIDKYVYLCHLYKFLKILMLNITQLIIVTIAKKLNVKNDELMEKEFVDNRKDVKYWKKNIRICLLNKDQKQVSLEPQCVVNTFGISKNVAQNAIHVKNHVYGIVNYLKIFWSKNGQFRNNISIETLNQRKHCIKNIRNNVREKEKERERERLIRSEISTNKTNEAGINLSKMSIYICKCFFYFRHPS